MLNTSIPLSGMQAATVRATAAANNIANMNSNGALPAAGQTPPAASQTPVSGQTAANPQAYQPVQVNQTSAGPSSGTVATVRTVSPSYVAQYSPSASYANNQGQVAAPNVDVMNEILNITTAKSDFTANANVADAVNQMVQQLFELK